MRKRNLLVLFGLMFFVIFAAPLLAADFEIDDSVVTAIVGLAILGYPLHSAIQALKEWLKLKDKWAIALSIVVSFGFTAFYLFSLNMFTWLGLGVYGALVTAEVNGIYKIIKPIIKAVLTLIKTKEKET